MAIFNSYVKLPEANVCSWYVEWEVMGSVDIIDIK